MANSNLHSALVHGISECLDRRQKFPARRSSRFGLVGLRRAVRGGKNGGGLSGTAFAGIDAHAGLPPEKLITGPSVCDVVADLTERIVNNCAGIQDGNKWIIGIAGPPGGGKTLLADAVCARVNEVHSGRDSFVAVVPMDGFHYTKAQLDKMLDPALARAKRGAHWTFDGQGFVDALRRLRAAGTDTDVLLPSFDHGVGDPIEGDIRVSKSTRVVLVEGNYLFLDIAPWTEVVDYLDEKWFAFCPLDVAADRVYQRHIETGKPEQEAAERVEGNDGPNAQLVDKTMHVADLIINMDLPLMRPSSGV